MLVAPRRSAILALLAVVVVFFVVTSFDFTWSSDSLGGSRKWTDSGLKSSAGQTHDVFLKEPITGDLALLIDGKNKDTNTNGMKNGEKGKGLFFLDTVAAKVIPSSAVVKESYHELFSVSTADRAYFVVDLGGHPIVDPSIIPHPTNPDTWIIVAQEHDPFEDHKYWFTELTCHAVFKKGRLQCISPPTNLPIPVASIGGKCSGNVGFLDLNVGPHGARVFWGPDRPYILYGSNSARNCFGQWIQDFRMLVRWSEPPHPLLPFRYAVDIHRPSPYAMIEKDWFIFWNEKNQSYVHHDVSPKRVFARLNYDGSIGGHDGTGDDLGINTWKSDSKCMDKFMPVLTEPKHESIHQATNSLAITMCERADPACSRTAENTFIVTIFQHQRDYTFHTVYEPYAMLFKQTAPFALQGISKKPLWLHGRTAGDHGKEIAQDQTTAISLKSMNWNIGNGSYHGYLDDVIFLGFTIAETKSGGIDVKAKDIIDSIGIC